MLESLQAFKSHVDPLMIITWIRQAQKITNCPLLETQERMFKDQLMRSCLKPLSRWKWGGIYQTNTNDEQQNSKLPNLEFCITNTLLNTNDYNSNSPQKLELAQHSLEYKDDKTSNTSAAQTNNQVLLCKVLPTGNGRKSSRKYKRNSWNASSK